MYAALKGVARRTTQSLRERVGNNDASAEETQLKELTTKVHTLDAKSRFICERVIKVAKLMEELGNTLKEIGEEYSQAPDLVVESRELAEDVLNVGARLVETSREHQKGLNDDGFGVLHRFSKHCEKLDEAESRRRTAQLEHDFFFNKVVRLRQDPPSDVSRIPRNEHTLENWRVELWQATESNKALLSSLYTEGRRAIDKSVLTTVQVVHSFVDIASTGFKQTFFNARLPEYSDDPVLVAAPLPPNPLPPYQPPNRVYGYTTTATTSTTPTLTTSSTAATPITSPPATSTTGTYSTSPYPVPGSQPNSTSAAARRYATPFAPSQTAAPVAGSQTPLVDTAVMPQSSLTAISPSLPSGGYQPPQVTLGGQTNPYTPPPV